MAKIDRYKEELGILKFWLGIVVATALAVSGWCITNFEKINLMLLIGAGIFLVLLLVLVFFINRKISKKLKDIQKS